MQNYEGLSRFRLGTFQSTSSTIWSQQWVCHGRAELKCSFWSLSVRPGSRFPHKCRPCYGTGRTRGLLPKEYFPHFHHFPTLIDAGAKTIAPSTFRIVEWQPSGSARWSDSWQCQPYQPWSNHPSDGYHAVMVWAPYASMMLTSGPPTPSQGCDKGVTGSRLGTAQINKHWYWHWFVSLGKPDGSQSATFDPYRSWSKNNITTYYTII